jgi:triacylglycerol lipase
MLRVLRRWFALAATTLVVGLSAGACQPDPGDPPLSVPLATLDAALECPESFTHPQHEPVLLVHGTFTNPDENWEWNYRIALPNDGYDVCWVTLPNRSLDDIQVASEYVVHAVRTINARSGRKVDIVGHSQGGLEPRWAVRWWPSLLGKVDDLVTLATPNHGTILADTARDQSCPACWQMKTTSNFIAALNAPDETPASSTRGEPSYTALYSATDELVQPVVPEPTAALDGASNILVNGPDVCPARPLEHVGFAFDKVVYDLVTDAFSHPGPAVVARAKAGRPLFCAQTTIVELTPETLAIMLQLAQNLDFTDNGFAFTDEEPPLKCYAGGPC